MLVIKFTVSRGVSAQPILLYLFFGNLLGAILVLALETEQDKFKQDKF